MHVRNAKKKGNYENCNFCIGARYAPFPVILRDGETKCHHFSQWCHSDFWAPMQTEEGSFHQQTGLKLKDETSKGLHLEHSFVWC